jgi:PAS domain S-box-containing protein
MADSPTDDIHRQFFEKNRAIQLLVEPETGAIVDANPSACAFYGYERDRLRALRITDLNILPGEQVLNALALAGAEQQTRFLSRHRLATGEVRDVEMHSGPVELGQRKSTT